jgi:hypothetical protein
VPRKGIEAVPCVFAPVDALLAPFTPALGRDFQGYRNHVQRVLNHYQAMVGGGALPDSVQLAAPFHDLGIWTAGTFDYLGPSVKLAQAHLAAQRLERHGPEVAALINEHHKLRRYRGPFAASVECYRRADLVDVSLGLLRFGLSRAHLCAVQAAFPDAGFHWRLATLTARQLLRTPLRPMPMLHW